MIRIYTMLTKPGIIWGNLITTAAGFALASKSGFDLLLFLYTLLGLSLVIASACVFNNCIDRHADQKMVRTQNRPLAQGLITPQRALLFALCLGLAGHLTLFLTTNLLATLIAFLGFFFYVVMYSFWKYRSVYGTLIGSIAGAVPPLVGYCAVSDRLDLGGALLFIMLVLWQMPHFYAIAIFRLEDYMAAAIPVLPLKRGMRATKVQSLLYVIGFAATALLLLAFGYAGIGYLIVALGLSLGWLILCLKGFKTTNDTLWARHMFRFSLIVIMALSLSIGLGL